MDINDSSILTDNSVLILTRNILIRLFGSDPVAEVDEELPRESVASRFGARPLQASDKRFVEHDVVERAVLILLLVDT